MIVWQGIQKETRGELSPRYGYMLATKPTSLLEANN